MEKLHEDDEINEWMNLGYSLNESEVLKKLSNVEEQQVVSYEELKVAMDRYKNYKIIGY